MADQNPGVLEADIQDLKIQQYSSLTIGVLGSNNKEELFELRSLAVKETKFHGLIRGITKNTGWFQRSGTITNGKLAGVIYPRS